VTSDISDVIHPELHQSRGRRYNMSSDARPGSVPWIDAPVCMCEECGPVSKCFSNKSQSFLFF